MPRIDVFFLLLATLCLIVGVSMGIAMGILHDVQFAPVHAHLNLVGWASLALFGLVYRAYPDMQRARLAAVHFGLASISAVMFPFGIYLSIAHQVIVVAVIGSLVWLAGTLVFLAHFARTQLLPSRTGAPAEEALAPAA